MSWSMDPFQVWLPAIATHTKSITGGHWWAIENPITAHDLKSVYIISTINPSTSRLSAGKSLGIKPSPVSADKRSGSGIYCIRLFFIISHRKDFEFLSPQLEKKKGKVTNTLEQSGLEPETTRSRIFVDLSTWAICELTNAGGKKIDETTFR